MIWIELYVWAMLLTAMACVRPSEVHRLDEWACASLAGAIWPVTIAVRLHRAAQRRGVRHG